MWNGKKKAITFSFDDNVVHDVKTIEIMNKYGLKGTFNLNSAFFGFEDSFMADGREISSSKNKAEDIPKIYAGHEIAAHTVGHPSLPVLSDEDVIYQVETDRIALSEIAGYEVVGMAYPFGTYDDRVVDLIKNHTGIKYSRTVCSTYKYDEQTDLLRFHPTIHFLEGNVREVCEKFFALESDKPQVLYIWGHTYEIPVARNGWENFEEFCRFVSGKSDVFYGTNREVILGY